MITGVGERKSVWEDGICSICLPLHNGKNAILSGLFLPKITTEFPIYKLKYIWKDILEACKTKKYGLAECLPKLPKEVGGDTEILVGIKDARYFPKLIFHCETGFGIFESVFKSLDGSRGVVGGPHKEVSDVEQECRGVHFGKGAYFCYDELAGKVIEISFLVLGMLYLVNGYYLSCMISIHLSVVLSLKMQPFIQSCWIAASFTLLLICNFRLIARKLYRQ